MLGKFALGQQIGKGKDSQCYMVKKEEQVYCMKVVSLFSSEKSKKERIEKEIEILKILGNSHENIINFEEAFSVENQYLNKVCLVTEVMEMDLHQYLKNNNGKLKLKESKQIANQLISAVSYCHSNLICHHDLKLENVTIDTITGKIKLIDFGMSTISSDEEEICSMFDSKGTPLYVSPEKFCKVKYDGRKADVWSCGVLIYRIITGIFPFGGDSKDLRTLALAVINEEYKIFSKFSPKLIDFFQQTLDKDQSTRISSADCLNHNWFQIRKSSN